MCLLQARPISGAPWRSTTSRRLIAAVRPQLRPGSFRPGMRRPAAPTRPGVLPSRLRRGRPRRRAARPARQRQESVSASPARAAASAISGLAVPAGELRSRRMRRKRRGPDDRISPRAATRLCTTTATGRAAEAARRLCLWRAAVLVTRDGRPLLVDGSSALSRRFSELRRRSTPDSKSAARASLKRRELRTRAEDSPRCSTALIGLRSRVNQ